MRLDSLSRARPHEGGGRCCGWVARKDLAISPRRCPGTADGADDVSLTEAPLRETATTRVIFLDSQVHAHHHPSWIDSKAYAPNEPSPYALLHARAGCGTPSWRSTHVAVERGGHGYCTALPVYSHRYQRACVRPEPPSARHLPRLSPTLYVRICPAALSPLGSRRYDEQEVAPPSPRGKQPETALRAAHAPRHLSRPPRALPRPHLACSASQSPPT
jgi:hypothetical protein